MGISIMANKTEVHNPINSNLSLVTNTICSARIIQRLGDGDYSVLQLHIYGVFLCKKIIIRIHNGKKSFLSKGIYNRIKNTLWESSYLWPNC